MHEQRPRFGAQRRLGLLAIALASTIAVTSRPEAQQLDGDLSATVIRSAIERALAIEPRGFERLTSPAQAGVRINSVEVRRMPRGQHVTIDLSQRALTYEPSGDVELLIDQMLRSTAAAAAGRGIEFRFLIDGLPLERFVRQPPRQRVQVRAVQPLGPIVISAGHGWYWNEYWGWLLQRDYFGGIVEDLVNWEIARYVLDELGTAGIDARTARQPDGATAGVSGRPMWQEGAKYFIRTLGVPEQISDFGINEYNRDINSRPFYANWVNAAAVVSIHNNGGGGTGTETWYDETNGYGDSSRLLAQIVNDRIVSAIRSQYDPNWPDRGLRSCNGCKGETRLAARPAVLVEIAFMDTPSPDNAALHDDRFKRLVAGAVREALQQWASVTRGNE